MGFNSAFKGLKELVVMYYYGGTFEKQQLARTSEKLHGVLEIFNIIRGI
jgi:hypothetical protein